MIMRAGRTGFLGLCAVLGALWQTPAAEADTFFVTIFEDEIDADVTDGLCITATGPNNCSLRAAIMQANFTPGLDTIILETGTYVLTGTGTGENNALQGDLDITDDLIIEGDGMGLTIIDGFLSDRVFEVIGATVTIRDLTVTNGAAINEQGGGIRNWGTLTLENVEVANNDAIDFNADGGGIANFGTIDIVDCFIHHNTAGDFALRGGGVFSQGPITITGGTISDNTSPHFGGGVALHQVGGTLDGVTISNNIVLEGHGGGVDGGSFNQPLVMNNCVVSGNLAYFGAANNAGMGGGVYSSDLTMNRCTIDGNWAQRWGGGLLTTASGGEPAFEIFDTTLSNNIAEECGGAISSLNSGNAEFTNCTFSGNISNDNGGAVCAPSSRVELFNCTVTGNTADGDADGIGDGGGIWGHNQVGAVTTIYNCIVAYNSDTGGEAPDIYSPWVGSCCRLVESGGYNIVGDDTGFEQFFGNSAGNQINVDPLLGRLADNGGPTLTHAISADSPAWNAANPECAGDLGVPVTTDQRGEPRPLGFRCDIGAFEGFPDCNDDGILDDDQLVDNDCNGNLVPDECDVDCNSNGQPDGCDIDQGLAADCNSNGVPDECDPDCNGDGIPNDCEPDCNNNGEPDGCDIANGIEEDCDGNGIIDSCQFNFSPYDCDDDGNLDLCQIADGLVDDCNDNRIIDDCELGGRFFIGAGYYSHVGDLDDPSTFFYLHEFGQTDFDFSGFRGLAVHPVTNEVYATVAGYYVDDEWGIYLFTVDLFTGHKTYIGQLPAFIADIAFAADGTLYGAEGNADGMSGRLWTIDPMDGSGTLTGIQAATGNGQSLAFDDAGLLYHVAGNTLETIDVETQTITVLTSTLLEDQFSAMGFDPDDGELYLIRSSDVYRYDDQSNDVVFETGIDTQLYGVLFQPLPEPQDCGDPADFNGDGSVNTLDLLSLLAQWGPCPGCPEDIDGDGVVGTTDLLILLGSWG